MNGLTEKLCVLSREGSVLPERNRPGLHFWEKKEPEDCSGTQLQFVMLFVYSHSVSSQGYRNFTDNCFPPPLPPLATGSRVGSGHTLHCTLWLVLKLEETNEPVIHNPNESIGLYIAQNFCTISKCKRQLCMSFLCENTRYFSWISGNNEIYFI